MRLGLVLIISIICAEAAVAAGFEHCWDDAAREFDVPVLLLRAIGMVESGQDQTAVNVNANGTYDVGTMQINSSWYQTLGDDRWRALTVDACYNIRVGAWLASDCIKRFGLNWHGIGCYNAKSEDKRATYATKVILSWRELTGVTKSD